MSKFNVYKMRCEITSDAFAFLTEYLKHNHDEIEHFEIDNFPYAGCILTIQTRRSISYIQKILLSVPNSHVMLETIQPEHLYTGVRSEL